MDYNTKSIMSTEETILIKMEEENKGRIRYNFEKQDIMRYCEMTLYEVEILYQKPDSLSYMLQLIPC